MTESVIAKKMWDAMPSTSATLPIKPREPYGPQIADPTAVDPNEKSGLIDEIVDLADCDRLIATRAANSLIRALKYDVALARRGIAEVAKMDGLVEIIREQHDPWVLKHKALLQARWLRDHPKPKRKVWWDEKYDQFINR